MGLTPVFIDIETTSPDPWSGDLITVQWAVGEYGEVTVDRTMDDGLVAEYLSNPEYTKVSHTLFDPRFLGLAGYTINGDWHDTRVMAHVLNENTPMDLDWLTHRYAGITKDKRIRSRGGAMMFEWAPDQWVPLSAYQEWEQKIWDEFTDYGARDIGSLRSLYYSLRQRLLESEWLEYFETESVPVTNVLIKMERNGLPVDLLETAALAEELGRLKDEARARLLEEAGLPASFNLNSQPQMVAYLFGRSVRLKDRLPMDMEPLPSDLEFEVTKVGRLWIEGEWIVQGRGLAETPHNVNKVTGEVSKLPSVSSPDLLYYHGEDPWVRDLCTGYRKYEKLLTTYLLRFPEQAVNERGETIDQAMRRVWNDVRTPPEQRQRLQRSVLFSTMQRPVGGPPPASGPDGTGVHANNTAGRNDLVGTPMGDESSAGANSSSHQRDSHGQSPGESDASSVPSGAQDSSLGFLGTFRLHPRYNQAGTVTGRLSSSNPNGQNQPSRGSLGKRVRHLFKGRLLVGDYDQLEMRLMGHFSEDPNLMEVFREGKDPHIETMLGIFGDVDPYEVAAGASISYRDAAKQLNYAMGYGAGPRKVAQTLSLFGFPTTPDESKEYLVELARHYRRLFRWKKHVIETAKRKGSVRTLSGRRRRLKGAFRDTADWKAVSYGERQAVNAIIQGSAADIINRAMVRIDREFVDIAFLAQVHDELVMEYPEGSPPLPDTLARIQWVAEEGHGFNLLVPMGFTPVVCDTWADKSAGGADWWIEEADDADVR